MLKSGKDKEISAYTYLTYHWKFYSAGLLHIDYTIHMIYSARPQVKPVVSIIFNCFVLQDLKITYDGRTTRVKILIIIVRVDQYTYVYLVSTVGLYRNRLPLFQRKPDSALAPSNDIGDEI